MTIWNQIQQQQKAICNKLKVDWTPVDINSMIAFNESLLSAILPLNGLRHPKEEIIDGWYLWSAVKYHKPTMIFLNHYTSDT